MKHSFKKVAVMTSGGDVPGLNACIRAIVRSCVFYGIDIIGIQNGYEGLMRGEFIPLDAGKVSHIIQKGGTILSSSRSQRFTTAEGRQEAYYQLKKEGIEALFILGGDGSLRGARLISEESGIAVIGIPKTIDNDISGTDSAIGFDTATNIAMEAIDRIKDTAQSHHRLFFVEVMGRHAGYIAYAAGMATGAEGILIPESTQDITLLWNQLANSHKRPHSSYIVVVAEGDESGGAQALAAQAKEKFPDLYTGVTILGHIQRGGSPTCFDRNLATRLGLYAVQALLEGHSGWMVGEVNHARCLTPLADVQNRKFDFDAEKSLWMEILSC